jgi:hypothetical protein
MRAMNGGRDKRDGVSVHTLGEHACAEGTIVMEVEKLIVPASTEIVIRCAASKGADAKPDMKTRCANAP